MSFVRQLSNRDVLAVPDPGPGIALRVAATSGRTRTAPLATNRQSARSPADLPPQAVRPGLAPVALAVKSLNADSPTLRELEQARARRTESPLLLRRAASRETFRATADAPPEQPSAEATYRASSPLATARSRRGGTPADGRVRHVTRSFVDVFGDSKAAEAAAAAYSNSLPPVLAAATLDAPASRRSRDGGGGVTSRSGRPPRTARVPIQPAVVNVALSPRFAASGSDPAQEGARAAVAQLLLNLLADAASPRSPSASARATTARRRRRAVARSALSKSRFAALRVLTNDPSGAALHNFKDLDGPEQLLELSLALDDADVAAAAAASGVALPSRDWVRRIKVHAEELSPTHSSSQKSPQHRGSPRARRLHRRSSIGTILSYDLSSAGFGAWGRSDSVFNFDDGDTAAGGSEGGPLSPSSVSTRALPEDLRSFVEWWGSVQAHHARVAHLQRVATAAAARSIAFIFDEDEEEEFDDDDDDGDVLLHEEIWEASRGDETARGAIIAAASIDAAVVSAARAAGLRTFDLRGHERVWLQMAQGGAGTAAALRRTQSASRFGLSEGATARPRSLSTDMHALPSAATSSPRKAALGLMMPPAVGTAAGAALDSPVASERRGSDDVFDPSNPDHVAAAERFRQWFESEDDAAAIQVRARFVGSLVKQVSKSLAAARVPSAARTRRDVAAAAASALLFDDSKPAKGVTVEEANWFPPPSERRLPDGSVLPQLDFVRAGLRPDFSALIQAGAGPAAAGPAAPLAAAANLAQQPARRRERRRSAEPSSSVIAAAAAAASSKAVRLAVREAFAEMRGLVDPVLRMDASDLLGHGGRARPADGGVAAAAGGGGRRRSMVAALRTGAGDPRFGGRALPTGPATRPRSRGSVASRASAHTHRGGGGDAPPLLRSSSAPVLRGSDEEEGLGEAPVADVVDGEAGDQSDGAGGGGGEEKEAAGGSEEGGSGPEDAGRPRLSRGSTRPRRGSMTERPTVSVAEQAASALLRLDAAASLREGLSASAVSTLALAGAIARDVKLATEMREAGTACRAIERRFYALEEACAADGDSDVDDGPGAADPDPDAVAAEAAAVAEEERGAIDEALGLLVSGGSVAATAAAAAAGARDGLTLSNCVDAEHAIPIVGAAAARLLYAPQGAFAAQTLSSVGPAGGRRGRSRAASAARREMGARKVLRRAAAGNPGTLALALRPLAAVQSDRLPGNGASDNRAEFLLLQAEARDIVAMMRLRYRASRLAIQAASSRLDRIRMAGMTDAERQRVLLAQQRAKAEAALARRELYERELDAGHFTAAERRQRCKRVAALVTEAWPAVERRLALARQWRVYVHAERATIKAIRDATASQAAEVGRARQERLDAELFSQELERAAMAVEDARASAWETRERDAIAEAAALRAFAEAPFEAHFRDEDVPARMDAPYLLLRDHRQRSEQQLARAQRRGGASSTSCIPGATTVAALKAELRSSRSSLALERRPPQPVLPTLANMTLSDGFRASAGLPTRTGFGSRVTDVTRNKAHGPPSAIKSVSALPTLETKPRFAAWISGTQDGTLASPSDSADKGSAVTRNFSASRRRRSYVALVLSSVGADGAPLFAVVSAATDPTSANPDVSWPGVSSQLLEGAESDSDHSERTEPRLRAQAHSVVEYQASIGQAAAPAPPWRNATQPGDSRLQRVEHGALALSSGNVLLYHGVEAPRQRLGTDEDGASALASSKVAQRLRFAVSQGPTESPTLDSERTERSSRVSAPATDETVTHTGAGGDSAVGRVGPRKAPVHAGNGGRGGSSTSALWTSSSGPRLRSVLSTGALALATRPTTADFGAPSSGRGPVLRVRGALPNSRPVVDLASPVSGLGAPASGPVAAWGAVGAD